MELSNNKTSRNAGLRFTGIATPFGVTLTSAVLSVISYDAGYDSPNRTLYPEGSDNSPDFRQGWTVPADLPDTRSP